jgi:CRISPR-associated protein Cas6
MLISEFAIDQQSEAVIPIVELTFSIVGSTLPADHGYGLYSALIQQQQALREQPWLQLQTISGIPNHQGIIQLGQGSKLRIRLPVDKVPLLVSLAGQRFTIGSHSINLGIPQINTLQSADHLKARIVTIKGYTEPDPFLEAAHRQLHALGIHADIGIPLDAEGKHDRKTIKIQRYSVVGFGLHIWGLGEQDSIRLQEVGLGGKRRMGCGVFMSASNQRF